MPFQHLAGNTTRGVADPVVEFFAILEDFLENVVGWTVAAGAGTQDIRFSSTGEGAAYTMLFLHIWRDGVTDRIRGEVSDDVIPTHETTRDSFLDGDGLQFQFWISADLDAVIIIVPYRATHRALYLGIVEPVAINPIDETYHMVASSWDLATASILRQHNNLWDQDITNYPVGAANNQRRCLIDQTFCPMPILANRRNETAGQYKHLGGEIDDGGETIGDELTSAGVGGTSQWKVFFGTFKYALQITAGTPADQAAGAGFAVQTGVAVSSANLLAILGVFLTGVGWTVTDPGAPHNSRILCYSPGESGLNTIYCLLAENTVLHPYVQDDAAGTNQTPQMNVTMIVGDYPATYWIAADLDGIALVVERPGAQDQVIFMGFPHLACPNIPDIYNLVSWASPPINTWVLESRRPGAPNPALLIYFDNNAELQNSNANAFDVATYCHWPTFLGTAGEGLGVPCDPIGDLRFIQYTNGGGIARLDTLTDGPVVYTVFDTTGAGTFLAVRTT